MSCEHRCGGQCCRGFALPGSTAAQREQTRAEIVAWRDAGGEFQPWMREHLYVADMLVPLTRADAIVLFPLLEVPEDPELYTCKHFDPSAGLCTRYEERPTMCRTFPDGRPCPFCGYTEMPDFKVEHTEDTVTLTPLTDAAREFLAPYRADGIDQGYAWELQAGYWPAFRAEIIGRGMSLEEAQP